MTATLIDSFRDQHFPSLENKAYFNFGGQGPMPKAAFEAIIAAYEKIQHQGPFCASVNAWLVEEAVATRAAIASEIGASADTITLTENVTTGCNIALWGIDWQGGDRLLLTDCEHPGIIAIAREIARRFQVEIDVCPIQQTLNEGAPVAAIEQALQPRTRLVVLSHLLWNTGQVLPLKAIAQVCHARDVFLLADAAQSAGSLVLDLVDSEVDFYAFTGHKWMCGPAGVGALYVRSQQREQLQPTFIGWRSVKIDDRGSPKDWKPNGQRYEIATSAYPAYQGLKAAIAVHQSWGTPEQRYQQIRANGEYLWQRLQELDGVNCLKTSPPEAGIVSFTLREGMSHPAVVQHLEERGLLLRTLADPDCIRACTHYFTVAEEMDRLVEEMRGILSR